jgi:16S rRNA processing protein RimM
MKKTDCYSLGYTQRISGLQGEVVLLLDVDDPNRYAGLDAVFLEIDDNLVPFFIKKVRISGNQAYLRIENIETADQAKQLVGCTCWLPLTALPALEGNRFYFHEIPGFEVVDEREGRIGIAEEVIDRMMQPVLRVTDEALEYFIPLAEGVVTKLNRETKTLHVICPDGLLNIYRDLGKPDPDLDTEGFVMPK